MTSLLPDFNMVKPHFEQPKVIGLSGYARSGKDTTADVLNRLYGFKRVAFADNLKSFVRDINPYAVFPGSDKVRVQELVDSIGDEEAKTHPEYRRLLQEVGNQARKYFGDDVWIKAVMRHLEPEVYFVISDVRYPNEADAIKEVGGEVWRVQRPGVGPANDHISEHALDHYKFDAYVINDGDITDLEGEVQRLLGGLG